MKKKMKPETPILAKRTGKIAAEKGEASVPWSQAPGIVDLWGQGLPKNWASDRKRLCLRRCGLLGGKGSPLTLKGSQRGPES